MLWSTTLTLTGEAQVLKENFGNNFSNCRFYAQIYNLFHITTRRVYAEKKKVPRLIILTRLSKPKFIQHPYDNVKYQIHLKFPVNVQ